ncbi:hypothetical protein BGW41_002154 [Actinomortierella wolfii]|nr:hypothetical protein BGW41_002154 [Actinomortierella wolfii]
MTSTSSLIIIAIPPFLFLTASVIILFLFYEPAREWLHQVSEYRARIPILNRGVTARETSSQDFAYEEDGIFDEGGMDFEDDEEEGDDDDDNDDEQAEDAGITAGSTTSARLRMHHEMVQQMRMRAGFAPEPFPGDEQEGEDGADMDNDEEGNGDNGGVGSSTGATAVAPRIKKIGKKKAKSLQRKEQMRAYHEFMGMQREERRQQEELFNMQQSIQQEERQRQRREQQERIQKLKEQKRAKEAKAHQANLIKERKEKEKEAQSRRDLRTFIHNVKSFRMAELVKRFKRSEALLLSDLKAIAAEDAQASESSPRIILQLPTSNTTQTTSPYGDISRRLAFPEGSKLVVLDKGNDMFLVLDKATLQAFADTIQESGRISKLDLSLKSGAILHPLADSQ